MFRRDDAARAVVIRGFRSNGKYFGIGDIVSPLTIRFYLSKLKEKRILSVNTEEEKQKVIDYLRNRYNMDISERLADMFKLKQVQQEPKKVPSNTKPIAATGNTTKTPPPGTGTETIKKVVVKK